MGSLCTKEVENFLFDDKAITSLHPLKAHLDMNFPRENSPTIDDFEDDKIVLISDESHHVNTVQKD